MSNHKDKQDVASIEKAVRSLLGYPVLPDGGLGAGAAKAAEIKAYADTHGHAAAVERYRDYCTHVWAVVLDDDDPRVKATVKGPDPADPSAKKRETVDDLSDGKGGYDYPDSDELAEAIDDPEKRAKCTQEELEALDAHKADKPKKAEAKEVIRG